MYPTTTITSFFLFMISLLSVRICILLFLCFVLSLLSEMRSNCLKCCICIIGSMFLMHCIDHALFSEWCSSICCYALLDTPPSAAETPVIPQRRHCHAALCRSPFSIDHVQSEIRFAWVRSVSNLGSYGSCRSSKHDVALACFKLSH